VAVEIKGYKNRKVELENRERGKELGERRDRAVTREMGNDAALQWPRLVLLALYPGNPPKPMAWLDSLLSAEPGSPALGCRA
jgi:hypothetical protein